MTSCAKHRRTQRSPAISLLAVLLAAGNFSFMLPPAVVITRLSDLGFGEVAINETKQVAYTDAGAASFRIDATGFVAQTQVDITFNLPAQLAAAGGNVPVTFSTTGAAWNYVNTAATATVFDPNSGTSVLKSGANFSIYVWIGASVNAGGAPPRDQYSNTLIMDAVAI